MNLTTTRNTDIRSLYHFLKDQATHKYDVVVPSSSLSMSNGRVVLADSPVQVSDGLSSLLATAGIANVIAETEAKTFSILSNAKDNISEKLSFPKIYWNSLESSSYTDILDYNITELFKRRDSNLFLRSFIDEGGNGILRAILSDKYRVIDNFDVLHACLTTIKDMGVNIKVESADITETRMHVRFYAPDVFRSAPELLERYNSPRAGLEGNGGDAAIYAGFSIMNSEVGRSTFSITPRLIVGACKNGLIYKQDSMSKTHIGGRMEEGAVKFSDATKEKEYGLIVAQIGDAVRTFCDAEFLGAKVDAILNANTPLQRPALAVDNVVKLYKLQDSLGESILDAFVAGGDTTRFGITQAITAVARDVEDADTAYELECIATDLMKRDIETVTQ